MHKKLFIPGPTEVRPEILKELSRPMIGHRSKEFSQLYDEIVPNVKKLFYTKNDILLSTSSGTGLMEGGIRNCVKKKCLNAVCGAFSKKWYEIALDCGKEADAITVDMGKAVTADMIDEKLATGKYDSLCYTHNETSTGVMGPIEEVAEVVRNYPGVIFMVDTVSSMAGTKIEVDRLGIDVCITSAQKCLALPPGLAIASVSEKAFKRAAEVKGRGHYFDFLAFKKKIEKSQTPCTPAIPHFYALNAQLRDIMKEGLDNRFERHRKMAGIVRKWVDDAGFEMFSEKGHQSNTVSCVKNTKGISVADLNSELGKRGMMISNGYGDLKEKTFRIAHMGDLTVDDINVLLNNIDEILEGKK